MRIVKTRQAERFTGSDGGFRSVLEIGGVRAAAEQLGLNRSTYLNWAVGAGIASTLPARPPATQMHYLRLRQEGVGRRDAALAVLTSSEHFRGCL